ncbi:hypothetical protein AYO44_13720 [Planctomycetaceae bacterium SCGC AG-212-F19]|nr:hypothetical protein AYO44_13720 [Planctomycetaceae bacterium SCGC AG-212-F19]
MPTLGLPMIGIGKQAQDTTGEKPEVVALHGWVSEVGDGVGQGGAAATLAGVLENPHQVVKIPKTPLEFIRQREDELAFNLVAPLLPC